jgi:geranylgeranyl diphosphate synthase type 3
MSTATLTHTHLVGNPTQPTADFDSSFSTVPLPTTTGQEPDGHRKSRFMEEGITQQQPMTSAADAQFGAPQSIAPSRNSIDPATVPMRTSSSRAALNGDYGSPTSPKDSRNRTISPSESKRKPKVSESDWYGASRMSRASPPLVRMEEHGNSSVHAQAQAQSQSQSQSQLQSQAEISQYVGRDLIHGDGFSWSAEKENIVKGPYDYLESHPGKDVRSQLINAFNLWLQVPEPALAIINKVIGMLHTASLLIDDVEDNSNLRRGVPVAHHIFGTAQTINSANYVYFCALQEIAKLNNPEAIQIYTDELLNLHRGQGMDLFWRDTLTCPSEDDYLEMVGNKTGGLFRLAIKLMHACSPSHNTPSSPTNNQTSYVPLVNTIGLLFQILDDYRNLSHPLYTANKGLCEDLTEGKFSFPIIHAIRANPANLVLINILKQKPVDDEVKKYAVGYMESVGSFAYTRRVLRGLTRKALLLVDEVDAGRGLGGGVRAILELLKVEKGSKEAKAEAVV